MGGCEGCHATLAAYNAYPSTSGYWRCADCIGQTGFATVEDFINHDNGTSPDGPDPPTSDSELARCPACGELDTIAHMPFFSDYVSGYHSECTECGAVWTG